MSTNTCEVCGAVNELEIDATLGDVLLVPRAAVVRECPGCRKLLCFLCWMNHTDQGLEHAN